MEPANSDAEKRGTAFGTFVEAEINSAWQRKASFETRSFSVITASFGVVTLYFLLQNQLGIKSDFYTGHWATLLEVAVGVAILSVVLAGVSALPLPYPMAETSAFDDLLKEVSTRPENEQRLEILEARVAQLKGAICSNRIKAAFVLSSTVTFALAVILLVISLTHVVLQHPLAV